VPGAVRRAAEADVAGLSITWLGHASVLIEIDGMRLLSDPVLGARAGPLVRIAPPVSDADLESIDAVLLSHLHGDHADRRSLRRLGTLTPVIAPAGAGRWLALRGLRDVRELAVGEWTRVGAIDVGATPALHRDPLHRAARVAPCGYLVAGSQTCYFAGDTDLFGGMGRLGRDIDVALLPIAGWGPRVGPGHLDPARAAAATALISPRIVVPIHWGTLVRAFSPRLRADPRRPARMFAELARRSAPEVEVRVLEPGERMEATARGRSADGDAPA
jgi:L-ascorbate metabolism protein UlaG (beta-lactamase superfamily)